MTEISITDQIGHELSLAYPPQRIVSLVPSQTELLFDLGIGKRLVGITKFCIHPSHLRSEKTKVGGTKDFKLDRIIALVPDLIIANKEENDKEKIEALQQLYPVWTSDVKTLVGAYKMILELGYLVNKKKQAEKIVQASKKLFNLVQAKRKWRVSYLIWKKPYITVGYDTFINDMLMLCGFENVFAHQARYPVISPDDLFKQQPDIVFLSSEPYPFKRKHFKAIQRIVPNAKVCLVDGELFSWYGSRLLQAPAYFNNLLNRLEVDKCLIINNQHF